MKIFTSDNRLLCPSCMAVQPTSDGEHCFKCGAQLSQQNERYQLNVGSVLADRYVIGKVIGQGGFGITYITWDNKVYKKIAIKEYFPQGLVDRRDGDNGDISVTAGMDVDMFERQKKRFVEEARLLARFSDEKTVVNVSDIITENSTAYIVMNYIDGVTLSDYIKKEGKLSFDSVYSSMRPIMETLGRIHAAGLIHRDISPSNLMMQKDGSLILLDFGSAREYDEDSEKSMSVILKPGYAPKEQYISHSSQGPWTDIYSISATMYKLITGVTPANALMRIDTDTLKAPIDLNADITPAQQDVLLKGMAMSKEDRYASMAEMMDAFDAVCTGRGNAGIYSAGGSKAEAEISSPEAGDYNTNSSKWSENAEEFELNPLSSGKEDDSVSKLERLDWTMASSNVRKGDTLASKNILSVEKSDPDYTHAYIEKSENPDVEPEPKTDYYAHNALQDETLSLQQKEVDEDSRILDPGIKSAFADKNADKPLFRDYKENADKTEIKNTESARIDSRKTYMVIGTIVGAVLLIAVIIVNVNSKGNKSNVAQTASTETGTTIQTTGNNVETNSSEEYNNADTVYSWSGDYVIFGSYEQDGNTSNGPEPIEWEVIDDSDGKLLLISRYILDCQPYNTEYTNVTWETCTLRNWLNNDFYNTAFSSDEQEHILTANLSNPDNVKYGTVDGNDTQDKVFCLSVEEIRRYYTFEEWDSDNQLGSCNALKTEVTKYAVSNGAYVNDNGCGWWWLRSPGDYGIGACIVGYGGYAGWDYLGDVSVDNSGVRPALYIEQ